MQVITLEDIQKMVSFPAAIEVVRKAFIAFSEGLIEQPIPMQILFTDEEGQFTGDCHVKAAQKKQHPYFAIKIASGFYKNVEKGLPPNNGLVVVMSAETGLPVALLQDEGWLTNVRTAAAGTLAASLVSISTEACLGLIGTGTQAFLHAQLMSQRFDLKKVAVLGRSLEKSQRFCLRLSDELGLDATAMTSAHDVCHASRVVVTATPSIEPVIRAEDLPRQLHIVAVGTDSPGKSEIDPSVTARADIIVTDNHHQCLHHGDFGNAVRVGAVAEDADISLCDLLAGKHPDLDFSEAKITLVDLTGMGAQDLAMAGLVADHL